MYSQAKFQIIYCIVLSTQRRCYETVTFELHDLSYPTVPSCHHYTHIHVVNPNSKRMRALIACFVLSSFRHQRGQYSCPRALGPSTRYLICDYWIRLEDTPATYTQPAGCIDSISETSRVTVVTIACSELRAMSIRPSTLLSEA